MPGRGGVSRGRADAPMMWGDESAGQLDRFQAKVLPRSQRFDPESSATLGVGAAAPTVRPDAEGAGLTDTGKADPRLSWRRRLSPRHKRAVKDFFRSDAMAGKTKKE